MNTSELARIARQDLTTILDLARWAHADGYQRNAPNPDAKRKPPDEDASPIDLVLRARAAFEKRERIMAAQATMRVVVDEVVPMGRDEWEAAADRLRELALKREHERNRRFIITDLSES